jgi:hypothetical protein
VKINGNHERIGRLYQKKEGYQLLGYLLSFLLTKIDNILDKNSLYILCVPHDTIVQPNVLESVISNQDVNIISSIINQVFMIASINSVQDFVSHLNVKSRTILLSSVFSYNKFKLGCCVKSKSFILQKIERNGAALDNFSFDPNELVIYSTPLKNNIVIIYIIQGKKIFLF